jgi:hypothetical protein
MSTSNPYAAPRRERKTVVLEARKSSTPTDTGVPTGTISEVMEWVGDDTERARVALEAETAGLNRKSLVNKLNELLVEPEVVEAEETEETEETDEVETTDEAADNE